MVRGEVGLLLVVLVVLWMLLELWLVLLLLRSRVEGRVENVERRFVRMAWGVGREVGWRGGGCWGRERVGMIAGRGVGRGVEGRLGGEEVGELWGGRTMG